MRVGIIGGTGPLGAGIGLRLAAAGMTVVIGSRDEARAVEVTTDLVSPWAGRNLDIRGADNSEAAGCEVVVVATPWEAALPTVAPLADLIGDHLVISVGTAIMKKGREFLAITPPRGSVTALLQSALPNARVVGACHHLPARPLRDLEASMDSDVLVCSDHLGAAEETVALLSVIEGVRAFYAGSLAAASTVEAMTAVLVTLNIRHKALTTLKIGGLGEPRL